MSDNDQPANRVFLSPPHMSGRELEYVTEAFASNYVAPIGSMLDTFEHNLSRATGIENVAALSSGTAAIHLALRIIGTNSSDTIWSSTLTFIGGVGPIVYQNATPVFFDVDNHGLIDLDLVEQEFITANAANALPKALIVTDLYGIPCNIARANELCERYGVTLISDSAESLGAIRDGKHAGAGADFTVLSFNGNKIITTSGGGALASDNAANISLAKKLATQAREPANHYEHEMVGYNYRLSNICAAIGVGQLEVLEDRVTRKREIAQTFETKLKNVAGVSFLGEPPNTRSNKWLTVMFLDSGIHENGPERIITELEKHNVESRPTWKPMHLQPVFKGLNVHGGNAAEKLFREGICLPSGTSMTDDTQNRVISIIRDTLNAR